MGLLTLQRGTLLLFFAAVLLSGCGSGGSAGLQMP
jgi:hypothetical protein